MLDNPLICHSCNRPFARLENGVLIIESRHSGETHTNTVAIAELARLCYGDGWLRLFAIAQQLNELVSSLNKQVDVQE